MLPEEDEAAEAQAEELDAARLVGGESVVENLRRYVAAHPLEPGTWLQGFGWDQNKWGPGAVAARGDTQDEGFPTRQQLDVAFPDTPVWLTRIDGHAAWANSAALRLLQPQPLTEHRAPPIHSLAQTLCTFPPFVSCACLSCSAPGY